MARRSVRQFLCDWREPFAALQSAALILAAIGGGIWAYYSYSAEQTARRAVVELERLEGLHSSAPLEVGISTTQAPAGRLLRPIIIDVSVTNRGSRPILLDLHGEHLGVSRIAVDSAFPRRAQRRFVAPYVIAYRTDSLLQAESLVMYPGVTRTLSYLFYATAPGLYHVDFRAPGRSLETEELRFGQIPLAAYALRADDSTLPRSIRDSHARITFMAARHFQVE